MIQQNTVKTQVTGVTEIARLKEEIQQLKSHNSVLMESWQEAENRSSSSARRSIDLMRQLTFQDVEIAALRQKLAEATRHLNHLSSVEAA